jgi:predicted O-methyltransferase YrrM
MQEPKRRVKRLFRLLTGVAHWHERFPNLAANVLEIRTPSHLKQALGWSKDPDLSGAAHLREFKFLEDINDRRLRDAQVIASACCNENPDVVLEIGTSHGRTTALMAQNCPRATIHTVNIPPEEIEQGGKNVTFAPSRQEIGHFYRERGFENIRQIFANTARWDPDFGPIDVAFVDGCHDADFVYNDTRKVLRRCRPGSIVMWHDFNPDLARVYPWMGEISAAIDRLFAERLLSGRILHLQDSWVGLYRVPRK